MANGFKAAFEKAGVVQSENAQRGQGHDRGREERNEVRRWTDIGLFYVNDSGRHERVASLEDRVALFTHYRATGEYLPGYSPFIRRISDNLSMDALDIMAQVNPDGSPYNMKEWSEEQTATFMENLAASKEHFAACSNSFCPSNYPLYEILEPGKRDASGKVVTPTRFARVFEHNLLTGAYWHFSRYRKFPGKTPDGGFGFSPWNFDIDYSGIETSSGEGTSRSSQAVLSFLNGGFKKK